jgi:hypothetical protein
MSSMPCTPWVWSPTILLPTAPNGTGRRTWTSGRIQTSLMSSSVKFLGEVETVFAVWSRLDGRRTQPARPALPGTHCLVPVVKITRCLKNPAPAVHCTYTHPHTHIHMLSPGEPKQPGTYSTSHYTHQYTHIYTEEASRSPPVSPIWPVLCVYGSALYYCMAINARYLT